MKRKKTEKYGAFNSKLNSSLIAKAGTRFYALKLTSEGIFALESRPNEKGRSVIVHYQEDHKIEILPSPFNARSAVNSYGGGAFELIDGGIVFSNFDKEQSEYPFSKSYDQRLYVLKDGQAPKILTDTLHQSYANLLYDRHRQRIIAVREDHTQTLHTQPLQSLVSISLTDGSQKVLAMGADFYASMALSRDGKSLAFLSWNYPDMPWDSASLYTISLDEDGEVITKNYIAGGKEEAICQPEWSPEGILYFISDRGGWWNLYRLLDHTIELMYEDTAEWAEPLWALGGSQYSFINADTIACSVNRKGNYQLCIFNVKSKNLEIIREDYSCIENIRANETSVVFIGGKVNEPDAIVSYSLLDKSFKVVSYSYDATVRNLKEYFSTPLPIQYPTAEGMQAYAYYYPPFNPDFEGEPNEKPPVLIFTHGGPTASTHSSLQLDIQYFTSRGFAVVDINYRGSTGFGRAYRVSLYGNWGIYDVQDCEYAIKYLSDLGWIDKDRVLARGGSAGGYTTNCLLAFSDICKGGASYFGISNLELLASHSDKFEAHYLDKLIGQYPNEIQKYKDRSPLFHASKVTSAIIFFQGLEDKIVPPEQTSLLYHSLKERGIPTAAMFFENEHHGFRISDNIISSLEAELFFYRKILGIDSNEKLFELTIENCQ